MILICEFSDLHEDIEKRLGMPVLTSQMPMMADKIKAAYKDDFLLMHP